MPARGGVCADAGLKKRAPIRAVSAFSALMVPRYRRLHLALVGPAAGVAPARRAPPCHGAAWIAASGSWHVLGVHRSAALRQSCPFASTMPATAPRPGRWRVTGCAWPWGTSRCGVPGACFESPMTHLVPDGSVSTKFVPEVAIKHTLQQLTPVLSHPVPRPTTGFP